MSWEKQSFIDNETVITADFLNGLQDQIIDDEANIGGKVDKETGKGLSSNDFTDALKLKLENLSPGGGEEGAVNSVDGIGPDGLANVTTMLFGEGAPTNATPGAVKQRYYDRQSGLLYVCTAVANDVYTWNPVKSDADGELETLVTERIGDETLITEAQTLAGGINENADHINELQTESDAHGEQIDALTKKTVGLSNVNFIDNPWFTINSRGYQVYSAYTEPGPDTDTTKYVDLNDYTLDRWYVGNNYTNVIVEDDGILLEPIDSEHIVYLRQTVDVEGISVYGKTVTLSVLFKENEDEEYQLYSATGTLPESGAGNTQLCRVDLYEAESNWPTIAFLEMDSLGRLFCSLWIRYQGMSGYYRAVKLEIGEKATLENDFAPDSYLELEKCRHSEANLTAEPIDFYANASRENPIDDVIVSPNVGISELYEIGKTYLDHADKICYTPEGEKSLLAYNPDTKQPVDVPVYTYNDNGTNVTKFPIVCGTFAQLMLAGVPYEQSRIVSGSVVNNVLTGGMNTPYSGKMAFDIFSKKLKNYYGAFASHNQLYSPELARMLNDAGMLHRVETDDLSELCVGDLLFFADYGTAGSETVQAKRSKLRWESIYHCELFVGWKGSMGWSLSTDALAGPTSGRNGIYYRNWSVATARTSTSSRLVYYARIPASGFSGGAAKNIASYGKLSWSIPASGVGTYTTFPLVDGAALDKNRAYTIIIKASGNPAAMGNNLRFNIYPDTNRAGNATQILLTQSRFHCGNGLYYGVLIPEEAAHGSNALSINAACDSGATSPTAKIEQIWLYDKLVAPSCVEIEKDVNPLATETFTLDSVAGSNEKILTFSGASRGMIVFMSSATTGRGMIIYGVSSGGNVGVTQVASASGVDITTANNTMTITNSGTSALVYAIHVRFLT